MESGNLNWIVSYIWGIADDVLRDLYVRGKYRDVILPMTVLRRLDAVLEGSHQARARHERLAGRSRDSRAGPGPSVGCRPSLLQHLEVHDAGPQGPG